MGKLERELRTEVRRTKINQTILATLVVGGLIAVGAVPMRVTDLLKPKRYVHQRRYQVKTALGRLIKKGLVQIDYSSGHSLARLTPRGERAAELMGLGKLTPTKPKRWDKKWRLLIFDIAEQRRPARVKIRKTLIALGFVRLQDSVWAYPYDCEDFIALLKADLKIGKDVLYIIADKVENDGWLRQKFGLS